MSKDVELLRYYLTTKPKMPVKDLKFAIKVEDDKEFMNLILYLIETELKGFNFDAHPSNYYILNTCLEYLESNAAKLYFKQPASYNEIIRRLLNVIPSVNNLLMSDAQVKKYITYVGNKKILESFIERIADFQKKHVTPINQNSDRAMYEFIYNLIFKFKNIECLKRLLVDSPNLVEIKDSLNKPLFEYVIEHYLNIIDKTDDLLEIAYYQNVISLISSRYSNKESLEQIKHLINRRYNKIIVNKAIDDDNKDRIVFHLSGIALNFNMKHTIPYSGHNPNYKYKLNTGFSSEILIEASKDFTYDMSEYKDYRDKNVFTIDDHACVFREDAVSLEMDELGNYNLSVYIVDLDSRIGENSILDKEAQKRALSTQEIYQHLFPKDLLNTEFSLLADKDHPVIAFNFKFDAGMKLIDSNVEKAIVNIKKNYDYGNVDSILRHNLGDYKLIHKIYDLCCALGSAYDKNNKVSIKSHPVITEANPSEHIITKLSVFVNSHIASYFNENNLPFLYRVDRFDNHDDIMNMAKAAINESKLIELLEEPSQHTLISSENYGFNKLGRKAYGCVTNPGRCYDALVNQRLIKRFMIDGQLEVDHYATLVSELDTLLNNRSELGQYYKMELSQNGLTKIK